MFCIQTFLFEYDIITSYMEDFSALKYTVIAELFLLPYIHKCLLFGLIDSGQNVSNFL